MILSGIKIEEEVREGRITILPYDKSNINPNSYNYTLGDYVKVYKNNVLDSKRKEETEIIEIPDEGLVLEVNKVYLGFTKEIIDAIIIYHFINVKILSNKSFKSLSILLVIIKFANITRTLST